MKVSSIAVIGLLTAFVSVTAGLLWHPVQIPQNIDVDTVCRVGIRSLILVYFFGSFFTFFAAVAIAALYFVLWLVCNKILKLNIKPY